MKLDIYPDKINFSVQYSEKISFYFFLKEKVMYRRFYATVLI